MNRKSSLLALLLGLGAVAWLRAADPMTFQELSLLVRTGEASQSIVNEVARRKLLQGLSAEQEAALRASGASAALITALQSPVLRASPEEAAAFANRRQGAPVRPAGPRAQEAAPRSAGPAGPVYLSDPFKAPLEAAKSAPPRAMLVTDAYSLAELPQARARALAERKALGFIMVTGSMFAGKRYSTRTAGSNSGLVHFYEVFKDALVLVFVRHETELDQVPEAVKKGFQGPDEGGAAPNMAVVDATASELVVEIPLGGFKADGPQRDAVFQAGAARIYQWLTYHPMAQALPATTR
jgi:hypothetical protein